MAIQSRLYTVNEFEQILAQPENSERLLELVNGEIIEKMLTDDLQFHQFIRQQLHRPFVASLRRFATG